MSKTRRSVVALLAGTFVLGGCGVRGSLELPPEQKAAQQTTATADSGQGKSEGAAARPHKGFILDGLLR
jgi:predicted small lipoprotein YifL